MHPSSFCTTSMYLEGQNLACEGMSVESEWHAPQDAGIGSRMHDVYHQRGSKVPWKAAHGSNDSHNLKSDIGQDPY